MSLSLCLPSLRHTSRLLGRLATNKQTLCLSPCLSPYLCVCMSLCLRVLSLSFCPCPSFCPSLFLSLPPSLSLRPPLSLSVSVCVSLSVSVSLCVCVCLSLSLCVSLSRTSDQEAFAHILFHYIYGVPAPMTPKIIHKRYRA